MKQSWISVNSHCRIRGLMERRFFQFSEEGITLRVALIKDFKVILLEYDMKGLGILHISSHIL